MNEKNEMNCGRFLRGLFGYSAPTRNDCGYPDRYNHEDTSRMHGWGIEGEGACDYPDGCEFFENGKCPFYDKEEMMREMKKLKKLEE